MKKLKVVLDTNIYFALFATRNPNIKNLLKSFKQDKNISIIYTPNIKDELIKNLLKKGYLDEKDIHLVDKFFKGFELVKISLDKNRQPETLRDSADWHLFALAHFATADYLVSGDKDILEFKPRWQKTIILTLREFSELLNKNR